MRGLDYTEEQKNCVNDNNDESRNTKKTLKKRIIAWTIGIVIFVGFIAGIIPLIKKQIDYNTVGDGAYQKAIKSYYEKVDETLTRRLDLDTYSSILNKTVKAIRFEEPEINDVELVINYEGNNIDNRGRQVAATYKVLIDYYNKLIDAEKSDNMLNYLDCLNEVFENMQYIEAYASDKFNFTLSTFGDNAGEKLAELFALDFEKDGIVKQIGFLSYNVEVTDWKADFETGYSYTCKFSGISYCETSFESLETMPNDENLISNGNVVSKNIKTYYREIEISATTLKMLFVSNDNDGRSDFIMGDLIDYVNGTKTNFNVKTTYFEETNAYNVLKKYDNMRNGNFDYKKPENIDMSKYSK